MSLKKINGYTLNLNKELGRGNFGVVYQAEQDGTRIPCAIKMLDKMHSKNLLQTQVDSDDYIRSAIFRQIQILKNLKCEHIVGFFDVMQSSRYYYIVQQLCDTDLERLMKKKEKFKQSQAIDYLTQICDGFLCLIRQGIVHRYDFLQQNRDLKPANIMLRNNSIKLGDFGLAKRCRNKRIKIDSSVGSPLYMSLQLLKQQPYSSKCDIWAVGCVFYQMLHGKTPWHARTEYALVTAIETQPLKIDESLSQNTKDFLTQCLQKRQCDRISWDDLFIHPIFSSNFTKYSKRNNQFENKLKMIMSDIRFCINMQNIDLRKLIQQMGFDDRTQLMFKNFDEFIRVVNPSITSQEVVYFFEKLDVNDDGRVSVKQLEVEMLRNHIPIDVNANGNSNGNKNKENIIQSFQQLPPNNLMTTTTTLPYSSQHGMSFTQHKKSRITQQLEYKIRRSFIKLYKILNDKKLTLYKTFKSYDQNKSNCLQLNEFKRILTKLDSTFNDEQVRLIFAHVDKDQSGTIEFDQFNAYYCSVNGVPQMIDLPPEYYYAKGKINFRCELNGNNSLNGGLNNSNGWRNYFKDIVGSRENM